MTGPVVEHLAIKCGVDGLEHPPHILQRAPVLREEGDLRDKESGGKLGSCPLFID